VKEVSDRVKSLKDFEKSMFEWAMFNELTIRCYGYENMFRVDYRVFFNDYESYDLYWEWDEKNNRQKNKVLFFINK
jgi:hypothetical protein